MSIESENKQIDWHALAGLISDWGTSLGFDAVGIADVDLKEPGQHLADWIARNYHGEMEWMTHHGDMRSQPGKLHEGTISVICVRINYLNLTPAPEEILAAPGKAYVARYALGRDYHKVIRNKLKHLSMQIDDWLTARGYPHYSGRPVTDSAPLLEKALAEKAGLGWIGKNTLVMAEDTGSWFFLGELLTNLPLPATGNQATNRCGSCSACMDICPTDAIVAPYQLDARKCISYLTIELRGSIPEALRKPMGNRVFGCDDCQMVCPWNRYADPVAEEDFKPRHNLDTADLLELFTWTEQEFLKRTEGSAIRRTGYAGWLRNLAVALGNSRADRDAVIAALQSKLGYSEMVDEHIQWALREQGETTARD